LKYWGNKCFKQLVGVWIPLGWIPLHSHNHLNYDERRKCPGHCYLAMFINLIREWRFWQRRKRKAEKVKVVSGACEEGILIFESSKSIIMNHKVDER